MPPECNPSTASQIQQIYWSLKNILGFEDPCKKYYEAIMIDSRFEINPLTVIVNL